MEGVCPTSSSASQLMMQRQQADRLRTFSQTLLSKNLFFQKQSQTASLACIVATTALRSAQASEVSPLDLSLFFVRPSTHAVKQIMLLASALLFVPIDLFCSKSSMEVENLKISQPFLLLKRSIGKFKDKSTFSFA